MILGLLVLRRTLSAVLVILAASFLLSCGGSSSTTTPPSGLKFRAFVSQDVSSTTAAPGLLIVNALLDRAGSASAVAAGPSPGLMAVSANRQLTMVFNSSNNELDFVDNKKESNSGKVTLPGFSESLAISSDATVGFAAVPNASVAGLAPGAVEMMNLSTFALDGAIPNCPQPAPPATPTNCLSGARFIVLSPDNTHLLVFGDSPDTPVLVTLSNTGTSAAPNWTVSSVAPVQAAPPSISPFDHPVWAVFSSDGATAFIMSCGAECGGTAAKVTSLNLATNTVGATLVLPGGASYASSFGNTLYIAGSAPGTPCPAGTAATSCGTLSIVNPAGSSLQLVKTVPITDGYHNRMGVTSDNQVFIGAQGCTNITSSTEQRGCLSMYSATRGTAVIGNEQGDVTAIQPVTGRRNVYVVENGELRNWSTVTDSIAPPQNQVDVFGQAVDVKLVD